MCITATIQGRVTVIKAKFFYHKMIAIHSSLAVCTTKKWAWPSKNFCTHCMWPLFTLLPPRLKNPSCAAPPAPLPHHNTHRAQAPYRLSSCPQGNLDIRHGQIQGGSWGSQDPPPPSPPHHHHHHHHHSIAIYKCRPIRISFKLGGLKSVKMAIPFFLGGGGGGGEGRGVSKEVKTLGKALPSSFKWSTTKDSQKLMIMQFSNFVTPPHRVSGSAPVRLTHTSHILHSPYLISSKLKHAWS